MAISGPNQQSMNGSSSANNSQNHQSGQTCSQQNLNNQNNSSGTGSPNSQLPPHTPIQHPPNSATPQTPPETPENHTPPSALTSLSNNTNLSATHLSNNLNNNLIMGLQPHQLSSQQLVHSQLQPHLQTSNLGPNGHLQHLGQLSNGQQMTMNAIGMHPPQIAQQQQHYFKQQMSSMSPPISSWDMGSAAKAAMNNNFVNQYPNWYQHDSTLLT